MPYTVHDDDETRVYKVYYIVCVCMYTVKWPGGNLFANTFRVLYVFNPVHVKNVRYRHHCPYHSVVSWNIYIVSLTN